MNGKDSLLEYMKQEIKEINGRFRHLLERIDHYQEIEDVEGLLRCTELMVMAFLQNDRAKEMLHVLQNQDS